MSYKLCAGHIFPVNRAVLQANEEGAGMVVQVIPDHEEYWLPSSDVLNIFYGNWGNVDALEERKPGRLEYNPFDGRVWLKSEI